MKLKPSAPGLLIRDPYTKKFLPVEGAEIKVIDTYWHRRIVSGDVVEVKDEPARVEKKSKKEGA